MDHLYAARQHILLLYINYSCDPCLVFCYVPTYDVIHIQKLIYTRYGKAFYTAIVSKNISELGTKPALSPRKVADLGKIHPENADFREFGGKICPDFRKIPRIFGKSGQNLAPESRNPGPAGPDFRVLGPRFGPRRAPGGPRQAPGQGPGGGRQGPSGGQIWAPEPGNRGPPAPDFGILGPDSGRISRKFGEFSENRGKFCPQTPENLRFRGEFCPNRRLFGGKAPVLFPIPKYFLKQLQCKRLFRI